MKAQLTWSEAIEKFMLENGYFATLRTLHREVPQMKKHRGKTPHKTINERVQRDPRFTRISPGIWALTEYLDRLPPHLNPTIPRSEEERAQQTHSSMQGILLEIGKAEGFETYTPNGNSVYGHATLGDIATLDKIPAFTYEEVLRRVRTIDVIWFNEREFPANVIEVEHTTMFKDSLLKFFELQDFTTKMTIVAPSDREREFENQLARRAFKPISRRCLFVPYQRIEKIYSLQTKLASLRTGLF